MNYFPRLLTFLRNHDLIPSNEKYMSTNTNPPNLEIVETPTTNATPPGPLTLAQATQLGGALARLNELRDQKIQTPTAEAEMNGLMEFVANTFLRHADEFIGCWFTIRQEYEPMIRGFSQIFSRVESVQEQFKQLKAAQLAALNKTA